MNIVILDHGTLLTGDLTPISTLNANLRCYNSTTPEQIVDRALNADVIITNKVVISSEIMAQLPNLKLICIAATGTNNVDLTAAKSHSIAVTNVAGYSTASVVQHTFSLIFNLLGNTHKYITDCKHGKWQQSEHFCFLDHEFNEVYGKTLTIVGSGNLGSAVANVANAFGMNVVLAERKGMPTRAGRVEFNTAVAQADIVSLHCPLNDDTRNLIASDELNLMKPSAVLINTARGGIVDENALVNALANNQIKAAAFDVLAIEPATECNPLANYSGDNLLLTPHIAWASKQSVSRLIALIAKNIQDFEQGLTTNRVA
jgi:glycerate dehydrogenase